MFFNYNRHNVYRYIKRCADVCGIEGITLLLDLFGLILISWYLFSVPKSVKFVFNQEYGVITSLQPIADAINEISRNFDLIWRMRIGFLILVFSLLIKLYLLFNAKIPGLK